MSDTIHAALVAALSDLTGVAKARTADTGKYKYSYASIEDVVDQTRPVLAAHGLVVIQPMTPTEAGMGIRTVLVHTSGETIDLGTVAFRSTGNPQQDGGAITYYRRYALLSALGMAAEDDDGAAASRPAPPPAKPITDSDRADLDAAIADLDDAAKARLKAEWKKRQIRKLDDLTVDDLDAVSDLIVEIGTAA